MLNQLTLLAALRRQRGLTSVEYAVAGGLVVAAIVAAMLLFDTGLSDAFSGFFTAATTP
jgi:Flp pilus assembly pilin Flp